MIPAWARLRLGGQARHGRGLTRPRGQGQKAMVFLPAFLAL